MIPTFPEFKLLDLDDRTAIEGYLDAHPPLASEYTFTNLYAWGSIGDYHLARFGEGFLIRKSYHGAVSFLQPLVPGDPREAVTACLDYLAREGHPPVIERCGEDFIARGKWAGFRVEEEEDQFDYVYSVRELIDLAGARFHDKKNLLNQFNSTYQARYVTLTAEWAPACLEFAHLWCVERRCEKEEGLSQENCAVTRLLTHFSDLRAAGGMLLVKGEIAAFTLGEELNPDTFVIHVEKARGNMSGIYQAINREFLRHAAAEYTFVNREQDLGVPGLRKAKQSYNPARMIRKYRITPA